MPSKRAQTIAFASIAAMLTMAYIARRFLLRFSIHEPLNEVAIYFK